MRPRRPPPATCTCPRRPSPPNSPRHGRQVDERAGSPQSNGGAPDLLLAYADYVQDLAIGPDARRIRRNAASRLLATHPDLAAWMTRPTPGRLADLDRTGAWPFITWCFAEEHLVPDLDLLVAKTPGDLFAAWAERHPDDVARISEVARRFGWSANWTRDMTRGGLAMMCLWARKDLSSLIDADFDAFAAELAAAPSVGMHAATTRLGCSASIRPATRLGSVSAPRERRDGQQRRWPNPSTPSLNPRSARWLCATCRSSPRPFGRRVCCCAPPTSSCSASTWPLTTPTSAASIR